MNVPSPLQHLDENADHDDVQEHDGKWRRPTAPAPRNASVREPP